MQGGLNPKLKIMVRISFSSSGTFWERRGHQSRLFLRELIYIQKISNLSMEETLTD